MTPYYKDLEDSRRMCNAVVALGRAINDNRTEQWENYIYFYENNGFKCAALREIGRMILESIEIRNALEELKQVMESVRWQDDKTQ